MDKIILHIFILFIFSLTKVNPSNAQELNCTVTVNFEGIPGSRLDNLRNFKTDIEKYINSNRWSDEDFMGERIQCTLNIFIIGASSENHFTAKVFIGSQRPIYVEDDKSDKATPILRVMDEKWEFDYSFSKTLIRDEFSFDPLTDFLDFYAYLIIGFDLDSYKELGGRKYFEKALNICNQAASTGYNAEWNQQKGTYGRYSIIDELLNVKLQQVREAFYKYHFDGLDMMTTQTQPALDAMLRTIETIAEVRTKQSPRSILIRTFFDTKYTEIAESFQRYPNPNVYFRLSAADPAHQTTYEEYGRKVSSK